MDEPITYRAIGHIEGSFREPAAPEEMRAAESRIVLDPALAEGLDGLEPGRELMVIFHLHRSHGYALHQHPHGDPEQPLRGLFALRTPRRPNPIGVSVVEIVAIEANVLTVRGLDALDGTPLLDLKPA